MKKIISIVLLLFALASCGKAEDTPQTETQTQEYQDMEPLRSSDSG